MESTTVVAYVPGYLKRVTYRRHRRRFSLCNGLCALVQPPDGNHPGACQVRIVLTTSCMSDMLPVPDGKRLFLQLKETGPNEEQAYTFVQELRTMAAENYITRIESKLNAQCEILNAQREVLEAQAKMLSARINILTWALGVAFALLVALNFLPLQ